MQARRRGCSAERDRLSEFWHKSRLHTVINCIVKLYSQCKRARDFRFLYWSHLLLIKTPNRQGCYNNSDEFSFFCGVPEERASAREGAWDVLAGLPSSAIRPTITQRPLAMAARHARIINVEINLSAPRRQKQAARA